MGLNPGAVYWMDIFTFIRFKNSIVFGKRPKINEKQSGVGHKNIEVRGSGCGSVGRAVTSDTKDPLFKCSHLLNFIPNMYLQLTVELDDHEEKQAGNGLFIKDI